MARATPSSPTARTGRSSGCTRWRTPTSTLPVTQPWNFFADYEIELSDSEAERIGVSDPAEATVYVTVRAAGAAEDFTANLRAPIIIADGRGFQVINEAGDPPVRAPLFAHPVG